MLVSEPKTKEVSLEVTVHQVPSPRQDSSSSTKSDNIPVITISEDDEEHHGLPRVKCMLKKQTTAIDEDVIIHFSRDLVEREKDKQMITELVQSGSDKSTSEETEVKEEDSVHTILNFPLEVTNSFDEKK